MRGRAKQVPGTCQAPKEAWKRGLEEAAGAFGGAKGGVVFGVEALLEEGPPVVDALAAGAQVGERVGGQAEMAAGAGPAPVLGAGGQPGSDGVELDITETDVEVRLVERHRTEAALPEGAAPALALIDLPGVAAMRWAERGGETVGTARDEEKVDVVRHQAPGPDRGPGPRAAVPQKGDIAGVIGVGVEGRLAPRAALGDVVRDTWQDQTDGARHRAKLAEKRELRQAKFPKTMERAVPNEPCQRTVPGTCLALGKTRP